MAEIDHRLNELSALLQGTDLSLATRRLMDLCDEQDALHDLRPFAMQLRAEYNLGRELGAAELSGETGATFNTRMQALLTMIRQRQGVLGSLHVAAAPQVVFTGKQLTKRFSSGGHRFELGPIDIQLRTGEITGVVGENGNGKTTLLRQIAGLLDHSSGTVSYADLANDAYRTRQGIAWIPQRSTRWSGTLMQNLRFTAAVHGITGAANADRVAYTLHRLGLTRFQGLTWKQLSSGYKLRCELARMVVWSPRLLVLDEPIANLDLQAQQLFLQDLKHLVASQRAPLSVILSSQQLHEIEAVADHILFLKNGKPVYNGSAAGFDSDRESNVFELKGAFGRNELVVLLGTENVLHVDDTGLILRLTTPRHVTARSLWAAIGRAELEVSYFRDISTSTRKLFHQDT